MQSNPRYAGVYKNLAGAVDKLSSTVGPLPFSHWALPALHFHSCCALAVFWDSRDEVLTDLPTWPWASWHGSTPVCRDVNLEQSASLHALTYRSSLYR